LTGDALPGLAVSDRGVDKALTLRDAFSILNFSDAKNAGRYGRVAIDFSADILEGGFRRRIGRILDAGDELAFAGETAVDVDCQEGGSENWSSALLALASRARFHPCSGEMMRLASSWRKTKRAQKGMW